MMDKSSCSGSDHTITAAESVRLKGRRTVHFVPLCSNGGNIDTFVGLA